MAAMVKLMQRQNGIVSELYERMRDAETNRFTEFKAAVRIQSWFRGIRVRNRFRLLTKCAVKIQKRWRGIRARGYYRERLKLLFYETWLSDRADKIKRCFACDSTSIPRWQSDAPSSFQLRGAPDYSMDTASDFQFHADVPKQLQVMDLLKVHMWRLQIQKIWRGYHSRRCVFDFNSRKKYYQDLQLKNQMVRDRLAEHVEQQALEKTWEDEEAQKKKVEEYASRNHFLISTAVIPGIYNSPFLLVPNEMEFHLRQVKPSKVNRQIKSAKMADENAFDPAWRRYDAPTFSPLPPVGDKPKGPFRDPRDVQWQRYRPFNPTVRVESNYYSVEEARRKMKADDWVAQVQDKIFLPSKRLPMQSYEPLSWTTSEFGHIAYGTKHFRDEYPDMWTSKNFQAVLPPIHTFDKFNKTYSRGEV